MDQREWDYGARLPRDRPAPEPWSTQNGPESTETPQWGSVADTGSLEPIPEAVAWAERADAWAQQPPTDQTGQWEQPASRWSEVAPTGRTDVPAEGVGWRTETAEWRATEQTARWRQTTEWRSTSGTHGWRSTTEAWQTGSGAEGFLPSADPPVRQQLAISGTAWPTSQNGDAVPPESTPAWSQAPDGTAPATPGNGTSWQQFADGTPPWQQAVDSGPSWHAFAAPPTPPWQQSPSTTPPMQDQADARPREQAVPPREAAAEPSWQQPLEPTQTWQPPADPRPAWDRSGTGWQTSTTGPYGGAADDGRHLVREDDRAQWRRDSAAGMPGADDGPRSVGRRRAPDAAGGKSAGGTGWTARSDADNWAGHTDTGSMPMFQPPPVPEPPSWAARTDAPSWRDGTDVGSRRDLGTDPPSWQADVSGTRDIGTPSRRSGPNGRVREADAPTWQPDGGAGSPGSGAPSWPRDGAAGSGRQAGTGAASPGSGVPSRHAGTDRPREIEAGTRSAAAEAWRPEAWRRASDSPSWPREQVPTWRRDEPGADRADGWRAEPDSGSWSRGDEPRTDGWRRPADTGTGTDADADAPSWRDGASWRRDPDPASDPWGQNAADTGVLPMSWQPPKTDTGSWRSAPDDGDRPAANGRRPADETGRAGRRRAIEGGSRSTPAENTADAPVDPAVWRRADAPPREDANWPAEKPPADWRQELREQVRRDPELRDAVTEIRRGTDPDARERGEPDESARGNASYRETSTGDWRRALAAESGLSDDEPGQSGTQDFVPFRPVGSAAAAAPPSAPASAPPRREPPGGGSREELLVGNSRTGARWQDPPDTQWPPRGATNGYQGGTAGGSYERRSVSSLPGSPGRQNNLLEPDDDEIEESTGGPLAAVGYTVIWYGIPVVLFVLYMLVLNGAQQAHALSTLAGAAPQFGLSLLLSMLVAVGLRWASGSWKAASVGLAAAVMGGGLATVLSSAISGNSLS